MISNKKLSSPSILENFNFSQKYSSGILVDSQIKELINLKIIEINNFQEFGNQIQPASLDLTLGNNAYIFTESFNSPLNEDLEKYLEKNCLQKTTINQNLIFQPGQVYVVKLNEKLNLPPNISAICNPKSSIGRIDVFVRVMTNKNTDKNHIPKNYQGNLFLEIIPNSFSFICSPNEKMSQIRFLLENFNFPIPLNYKQLNHFLEQNNIHNYSFFSDLKGNTLNNNDQIIHDQFVMSINLQQSCTVNGEQNIIGLVAKNNPTPLNLNKLNQSQLFDYFDPIYKNDNNNLILEKDKFYILGSKECVNIPPFFSVEMQASNQNFNEARTHYAGFFDPYFGFLKNNTQGISLAKISDLFNNEKILGATAVLEVRSRDVSILVRDGDPFYNMIFFKNSLLPKTKYGESNNNYQGQMILKPAKYFKFELGKN